MIAAQVALYVGLGIVIAVALYRRLVLGERSSRSSCRCCHAAETQLT
jgi:hypothetical protein